MSSGPDEGSSADAARQEESFKEQLDRRAMQQKHDSQEKQPKTLAEKITEYIPAAAKILGGTDKEQQPQAPAQSEVPGPPHRPDHDGKIEEFVREQHRSGKMTGVPAAGDDH